MTNRPPDLAILLVSSSRVVIDRLVAGQKKIGLDVRPKHGFVIRAVHAESPTINRLAVLLDTTKQAASKLVDAMVRDGFLARFTDDADRRHTRLRLTAKGARVRQRALVTSAAMERELQRAVGKKKVVALRAALEALLAINGAGDEARAHRARPVW